MMRTLFQSKVSDSETRGLPDGVSEYEGYNLLKAVIHKLKSCGLWKAILSYYC